MKQQKQHKAFGAYIIGGAFSLALTLEGCGPEPTPAPTPTPTSAPSMAPTPPTYAPTSAPTQAPTPAPTLCNTTESKCPCDPARTCCKVDEVRSDLVECGDLPWLSYNNQTPVVKDADVTCGFDCGCGHTGPVTFKRMWKVFPPFTGILNANVETQKRSHMWKRWDRLMEEGGTHHSIDTCSESKWKSKEEVIWINPTEDRNHAFAMGQKDCWRISVNLPKYYCHITIKFAKTLDDAANAIAEASVNATRRGTKLTRVVLRGHGSTFVDGGTPGWATKSIIGNGSYGPHLIIGDGSNGTLSLIMQEGSSRLGANPKTQALIDTLKNITHLEILELDACEQAAEVECSDGHFNSMLREFANQLYPKVSAHLLYGSTDKFKSSNWFANRKSYAHDIKKCLTNYGNCSGYKEGRRTSSFDARLKDCFQQSLKFLEEDACSWQDKLQLDDFGLFNGKTCWEYVREHKGKEWPFDIKQDGHDASLNSIQDQEVLGYLGATTPPSVPLGFAAGAVSVAFGIVLASMAARRFWHARETFEALVQVEVD